MEPKTNGKTYEIDLDRVISALKARIWLILLAAVLGATGCFCCAKYLVTPKYQARSIFYVNNSASALNEGMLSITSADISASRGLVESYLVILYTRETLVEILEQTQSHRTP